MLFIQSFLLNHKVLLYALVILFSTSCSLSVPQSSIYAFGPDKARADYIVMENDDVICEAEGTGNEHTALAFEITMTNNSTDSLLFDPREWSLQYSNIVTEVDQMNVVQAMDPSRVSGMYQELSRKAKANRDAGIAIGVILIVGLLVLIVAAQDDDDDCEDDSFDFDDTYYDFVPSVTISAASYASPDVAMRSQPSDFSTKSDYFNYKSMMVAKELYAPTYLAKGETRTFRLFFPREEGMTYLKIVPPTNLGIIMDEDFWFIHRLLGY